MPNNYLKSIKMDRTNQDDEMFGKVWPILRYVRKLAPPESPLFPSLWGPPCRSTSGLVSDKVKLLIMLSFARLSTFSHKSVLVRCPCAFRLRRLAQSLRRGVVKVLVWGIFIVNSRINGLGQHFVDLNKNALKPAQPSRHFGGDAGEILATRSVHDLAQVLVRRSCRDLGEILEEVLAWSSRAARIECFLVPKQVPAAAVTIVSNLICFCSVPTAACI